MILPDTFHPSDSSEAAPAPTEPSDLFQRGTQVRLVYSRLLGVYLGHAGRMCGGGRHRIRQGNRLRLLPPDEFQREGKWQHVGGLLYRWQDTVLLDLKEAR